ncbi:hypothetical protein STEG23_033739, partial [Scotinomys teguina]
SVNGYTVPSMRSGRVSCWEAKGECQSSGYKKPKGIVIENAYEASDKHKFGFLMDSIQQ